MKICIGIISGLPNDFNKRIVRFNTLNNLLKKCDYLFNLPVLIYAQNWKACELEAYSKPIIIEYSENLIGVTAARSKLREMFLSSEYDYMIMLDDDSILEGSIEDAKLFISEIHKYPNDWGYIMNSGTLKLLAISKKLFQKIEYPMLECSNGEFFEDMWLVEVLRRNYKHHFEIRNSLKDISNSLTDPLTTWRKDIFDRSKMVKRTITLIEQFKEKKVCT